MLVPVVHFAIETGMRMGEILSLEWRNVDMTQRVATLPDTKTGAPHFTLGMVKEFSVP